MTSWKHDIGHWQSRKSLSFQTHNNNGVSNVGGGKGDAGLGGDAADTKSQQAGFLTQRVRKSATVVSFGPLVTLPKTAVPTMRSQHPEPSDISLSALSDLSDVDSAQNRTRPYDDDEAFSTKSDHVRRFEMSEDEASCWVTVFGLPPSQFLDARDAIEAKCGQTVTHFWPATSAQCNWMYLKFEAAFDAARAVNLSPVSLTVPSPSSSSPVTCITVGVEWCKDLTFMRGLAEREATDYARRSAITASPNISTQSLVESGAGRLHAKRFQNQSLPSAKKGNQSIIEATTGSPISLQLLLWLNRRDTPEMRFDRLVASTNKKHAALTAAWSGDGAGSTSRNVMEQNSNAVLLAIWSTPWWMLWSNVSVILFLVVSVLFYTRWW